MLIRIVKMTFRDDCVEDFMALFEDTKTAIKSFEGCQYLELLRENPNGNVFFTYSIWADKESLLNYRNSPLFEDTWSRTKALFAAKPEAFSTERVYQSEQAGRAGLSC